MAEADSTNPEVAYDSIMRCVQNEPQMNFADSAVLCGIGEKGLHGAVLTDEYGPFVRYNFILTDAVIEPDEVQKPHLCDKCGKCIKGCPGKAIDENGKLNPWQCAVYYNGACGIKNPFMNPDAYSDVENRIEIIKGEYSFTPEAARAILDKTYFYPPVNHNYQCSMCGRSCDVECYIHLEEKGVLTGKRNTPFRKREPWKFDIKDFE